MDQIAILANPKISNCFEKAVNILDLAGLLYFVSFYK